MTLQIGGRYKLVAGKPDGSTRDLTGWFENLVTDAGLERMATNADLFSHCQLGAGSAAPANNDTALASWMAGTDNAIATNRGVYTPTSYPYYDDFTAYWRVTWRFAEGTVSGQIREVGTGWADQGSLFSRSLVKDMFGNPTAVTVLPDEWIDVIYECHIVAHQDDVTGVMHFNNRDFVYRLRMCNSTFTSTDGTQIGWYQTSAYGFHMGQFRSNFKVYAGSIAAYDSQPFSLRWNISGQQSANAYSPGSLEITHTFTVPESASYGASFSTIAFTMGPCAYQIGFDPEVPKTQYHGLSFSVTLRWGRLNRDKSFIRTTANAWLEGYGMTISTTANAVLV